MQFPLNRMPSGPVKNIADMGSGTGWPAGVLLIHYDSLHYFANDVDKYALASVQAVTENYLTLRKHPNTNTLSIVEGSSTTTNLPGKTSDKINV